MIILTTAASYVVLLFCYTELCLNVLAFEAPNPIYLRLGKPHMVGAFEHLRTLVGGQLPQGEGNLLMFVTNPHLVQGWGGGSLH